MCGTIAYHAFEQHFINTIYNFVLLFYYRYKWKLERNGTDVGPSQILHTYNNHSTWQTLKIVTMKSDGYAMAVDLFYKMVNEYHQKVRQFKFLAFVNGHWTRMED